MMSEARACAIICSLLHQVDDNFVPSIKECTILYSKRMGSVVASFIRVFYSNMMRNTTYLDLAGMTCIQTGGSWRELWRSCRKVLFSCWLVATFTLHLII